MLAWRRDVLGREAPPRVAVLTSGRDLDPEHPALHGWASPIVVTSADAARALRPRLPERVDVIGLPFTDVRSVIAWARSRGAKTVSVEAGPQTARALYADPVAIDELSWSEFLEPDLAHDLRGAVAFPRGPDRGMLQRTTPAVTIDEGSGRWRFSRWTRAGGV